MIYQCENKCTPPLEIPDGGRVICFKCGSDSRPARPIKPQPKVGTILAGMRRMKFAAMLIAKTGEGCKCKTIQAKMDRLGIEGCKQAIDELANDLLESAKEANLWHKPEWLFLRLAKSSINEAIKQAEKQRDDDNQANEKNSGDD